MTHLLNFVDLIAPVEAESFFQSYWKKAFLFLQRNNCCFYDSVLAVDDLDTFWQSEQLSPAFVKTTKSGVEVSTVQWTKNKTLANGHSASVVDVPKLFALYSQGNTLVINATHKSIPKLTQFCAQLEKQLQFRVQTNIYITPPASQGLQAHNDNHDVMVLQISGRKQWRLYDSTESSLPINNNMTATQKARVVKHTIELEAGDLLYVPSGLVHDALSTESASIHITLGFRPNYGYQLIEQLAHIAQQNPLFQQTLPHGYASPEDKKKFIQAYKKQLNELVQSIDIQTLLNNQSDTFITQQLCDRRGQFRDLLRLPQLTADSVLIRHQGLIYGVKDTKQHRLISFGDHQISVPRYMDSLTELILQDHPFAISELQGLITEQGKIDLVSQFVRSGFLRIDHV